MLIGLITAGMMHKEWDRIQRELGKAPQDEGAEQGTGVDAAPENGQSALQRLSAIVPGNMYVLAVLLIAIILLAIWLRSGMISDAGFFEPDGFFHYSVIRASLADGFMVPLRLGISGLFPHNGITEPIGLYMVTLLPYAVLQYFGVSYYTVMRLVPVFFGLLDALGAYFLVKLLSKNRALSLFAMLMVAVSSGDIARTAALIYRGDGFVSIFIIMALLFAYMIFRSEGRRRIAYGLLSGFTLSLATLVWGGAAFGVAIYIVILLLLIVYAFIAGSKSMIESSMLMAAALLVAYALERAYMLLYMIRSPEVLSGSGFFIFYVPIVVGAVLALELLKRVDSLRFVSTPTGRAGFLVVAFIVGIALLAIPFGSELTYVASAGGQLASQNPLLATIQELQPPSYAFLWSSFGFQLYLAPIGIVLFMLLHGAVDDTKEGKTGGGRISVMTLAVVVYYIAAFFISSLIITFLPTANEQASVFTLVELVPIAVAFVAVLLVKALRQDSGLMQGRHDVLAGFMILIGYMAVTFYLAIGAQRFNSLASVPLAIFSAYGIYALWKLLYDDAGSIKPFVGVGVAIIIVAVLAYGIYVTAMESANTPQADGINPLFLQAMGWMKNNTAANATVLALWPDGSVVEGWANRTSIMDSVGGQTSQIIYNYSDFLFSTDNSSEFLYQYGKPQYIVGREFWLEELGGIATEGSLSNASEQGFGYVNFNGYNAQQNATEKQFMYTSSVYTSMLTVSVANASHGESVNAYIKCNVPCSGGSQSFRPMKNVIFYNASDGNYSDITSTSNAAANLTLMISYNGTRTLSAAVLGSALPESNLFKIGLLCRINGRCPYVNPNVTLTPVYQNQDTTILKVTYK